MRRGRLGVIEGHGSHRRPTFDAAVHRALELSRCGFSDASTLESHWA